MLLNLHLIWKSFHILRHCPTFGINKLSQLHVRLVDWAVLFVLYEHIFVSGFWLRMIVDEGFRTSYFLFYFFNLHISYFSAYVFYFHRIFGLFSSTLKYSISCAWRRHLTILTNSYCIYLKRGYLGQAINFAIYMKVPLLTSKTAISWHIEYTW